MGLVREIPAAGQLMAKLLRSAAPWFAYISLAAAILLIIWLVYRIDRYRDQTTEVISQTFEVQWQASMTRESTAYILGYLELATKTGEVDPALTRTMLVLENNFTALLQYQDSEQVLEAKTIALIKGALATTRSVLQPAIEAGEYQKALECILVLRQDVYRIAGSAVNHNQAVNQTIKIDGDAGMVVTSLVALIIALLMAAIIYHRANLVAKRERQHYRSFLSLFTHMTRTRVMSTRLFFEMSVADGPPDRDMFDACYKNAIELSSIVEDIISMSRQGRPDKVASIGDVINSVLDEHADPIASFVDKVVRNAVVPAPQFHLVIDELIRNAEDAISEREDGRVIVRAYPMYEWVIFKKLIIEVTDNGIGMTPDIRGQARIPFFSTKSGTHTGMGLSQCEKTIKSMSGRLTIKSDPGVGTTIVIHYPYRRSTGRHTQPSRTESRTVSRMKGSVARLLRGAKSRP